MTDHAPLKVAILWHMHQPNYQEPNTKQLILPWVRLHATKDYLDMPLTAAQYENVRVTFNLVPSLIDQFQLYQNGGTDRHLELSKIPAHELTEELKREILNTFFCSHPPRMIEPYERYYELFRKLKKNMGDPILPALFTSEEMRDLQVWSNLVWIDPMFRTEEPIKSLFDKQKQFTEEEKHALLEWQIALIGRIIPTYQKLYKEGNIDISFTPYYHPILPLLCDTEVAREALPSITLPRHRFRHPEDAERQISMSKELFHSLFGREMVGMWPSEGSVSEEVAHLLIKSGIRWAATDEEILYYSLKKSGLETTAHTPHAVYEYGPGLKLFFRNHALSDRIGFVYSGWDADKAVADFMIHLKNIRSSLIERMDTAVVPIILDGENAWEYFPNDGHDFLNELYRQFDTDPEIETVTMTEAAQSLPAISLPSLFAGSWINHNFRIWIGHEEDNKAWDLLAEAREAVIQFEKEHPDADREKLAAAWKQIYIAEGSDWCWWFGDEHLGQSNEEFDRIFRRHLTAVYELLDLEVPFELLSPIHKGVTLPSYTLPDSLLTPIIDGKRTHFYEWAGAGRFDCSRAGGAMHRVDRYLDKIFFAYDHEYFYVRVDFLEEEAIKKLAELKFLLTFFTPAIKNIEIILGEEAAPCRETETYRYCLDKVLEIAVKRTYLWEDGFGTIGLKVELFKGRQLLETQPEKEAITFEVYQKQKELFWPT